MKIRTGFITNSSSTNFLIISKKELTEEYLFHKLGFIEGGMLENQGRELCANIMKCLTESVDADPKKIQELLQSEKAQKYKDKSGWHIYIGNTSSDDNVLTQFFTTDSFEIEQKTFYLNGKECMW